MKEDNVWVEGSDRIRPLALRIDRPTADTPDASIAHGDSNVPTREQKNNSESVRVEGADRMTLLELRTGRPATDTPDASIAHGRSTVITCELVFNHLNPPVTIYLILDFFVCLEWIDPVCAFPP